MCLEDVLNLPHADWSGNHHFLFPHLLRRENRGQEDTLPKRPKGGMHTVITWQTKTQIDRLDEQRERNDIKQTKRERDKEKVRKRGKRHREIDHFAHQSWPIADLARDLEIPLYQYWDLYSGVTGHQAFPLQFMVTSHTQCPTHQQHQNRSFLLRFHI